MCDMFFLNNFPHNVYFSKYFLFFPSFYLRIDNGLYPLVCIL